MDSRRSQLPLVRFFAGLAEYTFQTRLGIADPPLIQYVSELLARFVHVDGIWRVRDPAGNRLEAIAEMLVEAEARTGEPRREVHRHIGDFALFWTGVYPERLETRRHRISRDALLNYRETGKRSYYIASTLEPDDTDAPDSQLLERLSHEFDLCARGLAEVRREWERAPDGGDTPPLLVE